MRSEDEGRLLEELDLAKNENRLLRAQLERSLAATSPSAPAAANLIHEHRRQRLHLVLDWIQRITPAPLRALLRGVYLKYFYYRLYPENSPEALRRRVVFENRDSGLMAYSGYPPFLEMKKRICRSLNMGYRVRCPELRDGLVSVVLPVYNGAEYLAESIESVLSQDYNRWELIVVDDGSTDATPAILQRYETDSRVRIIRQENRKLPEALNTGFAAAGGEFFTWTSADNAMRPGMLSALANFLQTNPSAEMVYANEELIDESGRAARGRDFCRIYQHPPGGSVLWRPYDPGELNFVQNNLIGGCFLYRGQAARILGGYTPACFGYEDYDYWLRMNALFRIAHLGSDEPLYRYRLHGAALSAREKELRIAEHAGYFFAAEGERQTFFEDGFDITFHGEHPWFAHLSHAYRRAGHNVMEIGESSADAQYRYWVTRAYRKAVIVSADDVPATLLETGQSFVEMRLNANRLSCCGVELAADDPDSLEYPLLAAANSLLWRREKRPEVP